MSRVLVLLFCALLFPCCSAQKLSAETIARENTKRKKWVHGPGHAREKQETVSDAGMQTLAHNLSKNPFRRWSSVTRVKVGFRISAKCAGSAAMHSTVLVSLSHMNTIWSNTAGCAVRTP